MSVRSSKGIGSGAPPQESCCQCREQPHQPRWGQSGIYPSAVQLRGCDVQRKATCRPMRDCVGPATAVQHRSRCFSAVVHQCASFKRRLPKRSAT